MPEFKVGDRIKLNDSWSSGATGYIDQIGRYILVRLDNNDYYSDHSVLRAFNTDGTGTGHYAQVSLGAGSVTVLNTDRCTTIELLEKPTFEYPPEPFIGYGCFNGRYRPVEAGGATDSAVIGYGIINLPKTASGLVREDPENKDLQTYLRHAQDQWKEECAAIDFDKVENPLEFLVGLTAGYTDVTRDYFYMECYLNGRYYDSLQFNYHAVQLATGIETPRAIMSMMSSGHKIVAVEDTKITLENGFEFTLDARFSYGYRPTLNRITSTMKKILLDNHVTQRSLPDSAEATPVNDDESLVIAA